MRSAASGAIMMNFKIFPTLTPKVQDKVVSFVGFEGKDMATYRVRVKTRADAEALKEAIDEEVKSISAFK